MTRRLVGTIAALACVGMSAYAEETAAVLPGRIAEAVSWLETEAHRMIRASKREMKDGTAAFPLRSGSDTMRSGFGITRTLWKARSGPTPGRNWPMPAAFLSGA
jgi:hypothetical protein